MRQISGIVDVSPVPDVTNRSESRTTRGRAPGRILAAVAAVAVAMTGACSSSDDESDDTSRVVQLGGPGETSRVLGADELDELGSPSHTDADVSFVQAMIVHHRQALAMTAMVDERAGRDDLSLMADRMTISQVEEIDQLTTWLEARGEVAPADHAAHDEAMPGMLTTEQLAQLEAARGEAFDELFLQYMIIHHEGAVQMVEELLTGGAGGQESQVFQLAQHVESDQQVEISRMRAVLVELADEG
jgi:uncharacterized protein (DUF305 family)